MGVCGHAPPETFLTFSSSEVDFEPASANSIVEPRTLERPLHLFADRILFWGA